MLVLEKLVSANASGHDALSLAIIHEPQKVPGEINITCYIPWRTILHAGMPAAVTVQHPALAKTVRKTCMDKMIRAAPAATVTYSQRIHYLSVSRHQHVGLALPSSTPLGISLSLRHPVDNTQQTAADLIGAYQTGHGT
jgi:hypothetical protein